MEQEGVIRLTTRPVQGTGECHERQYEAIMGETCEGKHPVLLGKEGKYSQLKPDCPKVYIWLLCVNLQVVQFPIERIQEFGNCPLFLCSMTFEVGTLVCFFEDRMSKQSRWQLDRNEQATLLPC
jgi:hypothetical protein